MSEAAKAPAGAIRDDWEKAVSYSLTDEDIERARLLLGVDTASATREYIQTATTDNIRNFAFGVGNDNPLHCDPDYARVRLEWLIGKGADPRHQRLRRVFQDGLKPLTIGRHRFAVHLEDFTDANPRVRAGKITEKDVVRFQ